MDTAAQIEQARQLHRQGNLALAEQIYSQILQTDPGCFSAYLLLGVLRSQQGQGAQGIALIGRALQINPDDFEALSMQGSLLMAEHRFAEALETFDRTLTLWPDLPQGLYNRGLALAMLGRFEEASASYDGTIARQPDFAFAWLNRGIALGRLGRFDAAIESYDRAVVLQPTFVEAVRNRGDILRKLKRFEEALASYDRAAALDPGNAVTWNWRGLLLGDMNRLDEAMASYDKAVALKPDYADALVNRASLQWFRMGRRYDGATKDLQRALTSDPFYPCARGELLHIRMHAAEWRDFLQEKTRIDHDIRDGHLVVQPFAYQAVSASPADLAACSRLFARLYPAVPSPAIPRSRSHGKIRIGYLSADFREQATAYLTVGLFERHDRDKFEIFAFDNGGGDGSAIRARLENAFDRMIDISHLPDHLAAERIRAEEIDILVNLNGYFGAHRTGIFARRPAPVQVNFLGFPATLGTSYMDYIVADRIVIPEDERHHYSEHVVWLPDCYQVNDSKRPIADDAPTRAESGLPDKAFTFCNFNQSYKITPAMFALWMRILQQVPDSVFWLLDDIPEFRENLRRAAEGHGVAASRLVFAPRVAVDKHLARLKLADLFLDSLPYNAHTTASDALWAGVPLLTCRGATFPGRVAASMLGAAGLPELVTETLEAYEQLAVTLAVDGAQLGAMRQRLQQNRLNCALFDTDRFRRHIEAAYATMWDIWRREEAPRAFSV
jgi:predicted O-linked N-acetylglucosamine transferase (SPINDLY family)